MNSFSIRIKIPDGKVKEIMDRLDKAQREINDCYHELSSLGVLVIEEKTDSGN